ncbi:MAG: histidinol-phosphate transaminase [Neisseria sp.]|nr:histidinol-phosphate transaminase [Neisseria sp.]
MDRRSLFKLTGASMAGVALSSLPVAALARTETTYRPGALPRPSAKNPLLLNFNENSIGMAPSAKKAVIASLDKAFRYPDDQRAALVSELAAKFGVSEKHISIGNGSSENIQGIVQAMIHKAQANKRRVQVIVPDPTFNYAELYAKSNGVDTVKVPLTQDLLFDVAAMQKAAATFKGNSIFYLCNPNNPTATITDGAVLRDWIANAPGNQFFLLDEAYAEFVTDARFVSGIEWVKQGYKNVAVTRTFSKLYALAGLRVGYAIAVPELIEQFEGFMSIDNTNLAAASAAVASLQDPNFQRRSVESISRSRAIVTQALDELGLKYVPSNANFIFHEVKGSVKTYQERMKAQHVVVGREFPPAVGWNRLTLGTPEEMTVFVRVLKDFRTKGWV